MGMSDLHFLRLIGHGLQDASGFIHNILYWVFLCFLKGMRLTFAPVKWSIS